MAPVGIFQEHELVFQPGLLLHGVGHDDVTGWVVVIGRHHLFPVDVVAAEDGHLGEDPDEIFSFETSAGSLDEVVEQDLADHGHVLEPVPVRQSGNPVRVEEQKTRL